MYFQYGYFKPLAARKVGAVMTVRQIIPASVIAAFVMGMALAWPVPVLRAPLAAAAAAYAAVDAGIAIREGASSRSVRTAEGISI